MDEKKMTLEDLIGWLDDNDVSCEIDDAGRLTVKSDLIERFRNWVGTCRYTGLPEELFRVNGELWLGYTSIVSLGGLTSVGGSLNLAGAPTASLGNLTSVGGWLDLRGTYLASLGNLTSVGGGLDLKGTSITSLGNLTSVGESLNLEETPIASLGNLTSVGRWFDLRGALLASLNDLPQVGGDLHLDQDQFQLLTREALQKVKGEVRYRRGQATEEWWLTWGTLSPDELETIVAENERRESLHNTRGSDVDWDLYDR